MRMNITLFDQQINKLQIELIKKIKQIGIMKSAKICGLKQPDISAFIHGKRKWSVEKKLKIFKKLKKIEEK